jgi:hypothetical protein
MKTMRTALTALATTLAAAPALAATGARVDHSGILVWAFLGLCALIVVAQVVPAALLLVEMVKGLVTKEETAPARK